MTEKQYRIEKSLERLYGSATPDPRFAARLGAQLELRAGQQTRHRLFGGWQSIRRWGLELAAVVVLVLLLVVSIRLLPQVSAPLPAASATTIAVLPTAAIQTSVVAQTPALPSPTDVPPTPTPNTSGDGFALYLLDRPLNEKQMSGLGFAAIIRDQTALLTAADLTAYHLERHAFELTPAAYERIKNLESPVDGLPFVVTTGSAPVYQGAFWPLYSSLIYDGLAIWLPLLETNIMPVDLGYPGPDFFSGPDNRGHISLMIALHKAGLIDWDKWLQPPEARSGITELDTIITAVLEQDSQTLGDLLHYTTTACTKVDGLGGPPKCEPDQTEGTMVQVLPVQGSEGHYVYPAGIDYTLAFVTDVSGLVAVYRVAEDAPAEPWWPAGEYALVFLQETGVYPQIITLYTEAGQIVRLGNTPGESLAGLIKLDVGEWLLPPLGWNADDADMP